MAFKYAKPYEGNAPQSRGKCKVSDCTATASPAGTGYCSTHDLARTPIGEQPKSDPELTGILAWNIDESVEGISGKRIRDCIWYQLKVRKHPWYVHNLSRGFVLRNVKRLDDDTPPDFVYDPDPLFGFNVIHNEDGDVRVGTVLRAPKNEAERIKIREEYGVSWKTIKFLAKKDCPVCKGKGQYSASAYPGDPIYGRLTETIECNCSYE